MDDCFVVSVLFKTSSSLYVHEARINVANTPASNLFFIIMFVWFINVINNLFDANLCVNTWIPANLIDL